MTRFSFSVCVQQTDLSHGNVLNYGPHMDKRAGGINQLDSVLILYFSSGVNCPSKNTKLLKCPKMI